MPGPSECLNVTEFNLVSAANHDACHCGGQEYVCEMQG